MDAQSYHQKSNNYKNSDLRKWLNNEFLDKAFDDTSLLLTTEVDNSVASTGQTFNPDVCETTYDKIFPLSYEELSNVDYGFSDDYSRICEFSNYADYKIGNNNKYYWTRSPYHRNNTYLIRDNGRYYRGYNYFVNGVSPALWLNVE